MNANSTSPTTPGLRRVPTFQSFNGLITDGLREGSGRGITPNNSVATGLWKHGQRTGKGSHSWGDIMHRNNFSGTFIQDKIDGPGKVIACEYYQGDVYNIVVTGYVKMDHIISGEIKVAHQDYDVSHTTPLRRTTTQEFKETFEETKLSLIKTLKAQVDLTKASLTQDYDYDSDGLTLLPVIQEMSYEDEGTYPVTSQSDSESETPCRNWCTIL